MDYKPPAPLSYKRDVTSDVKPHRSQVPLQRHHAHYFCHPVVLHDGEVIEGFAEDQRLSGRGRLRDPLDVQTSRGGLLGTAVVCRSNLETNAETSVLTSQTTAGKTQAEYKL